jgi:hypothetical protein
MSRRLLTFFGQVAVFGLIALVLGYFSTSPAYIAFPEDQARILLDFSHVGQRKGECRRLTPEEMAEMAANMRRAEICPRERLPVDVELEIDGELIFSRSLPPSGLSGDGASQIYESIRVRPGEHSLIARLRDSAREAGFDFEAVAEVVLQPKENFVIDFRSELGGFIFGAGRAPSVKNGD